MFCHSQYISGIFFYISSHTTINPNRLPVLVYVWDEVFFSCRAHILNQKCRISTKNCSETDSIASTVFFDFILFNTLIFFVFG